MQFSAKLIELLPLQTGTGKNGEWKKQEIIVETEGLHPKKVCVSIWGDKIDKSQLQIGNKLKIDFDIESREYRDKWYTDIKAWKIELIGPKTPKTDQKGDLNEVIEIEDEEDEDYVNFVSLINDIKAGGIGLMDDKDFLI
jgi:hypothetical protein